MDMEQHLTPIEETQKITYEGPERFRSDNKHHLKLTKAKNLITKGRSAITNQDYNHIHSNRSHNGLATSLGMKSGTK